MAKNAVADWSTTAASNTDIGGISIAEGMSPGNVNNAMRETMAQIATWRSLVAQLADNETVSGDWTFSGTNSFSGTTTLATVDINAGAIDGTNIGAASPGTGAFTTLSTTGAITSGGKVSADGKALACEFIASTDASASASIAFTGFDASKYDAYMFVLQNIIPTNDGTMLLRTSTNGGSSYDNGSADYNYASSGYDSVAGARQASDNSATSITMTPGGVESTGNGFSGRVMCYGPHLTKETMFTWEGAYFVTTEGFAHVNGGGVRDSAADVDALQFTFSSGSIASGTITMYGLRNG